MTMEPYEMLLPRSTWLSEGLLLVHVIVTLLSVGRVLKAISIFVRVRRLFHAVTIHNFR
jgi:hypothetical protein